MEDLPLGANHGATLVGSMYVPICPQKTLDISLNSYKKQIFSDVTLDFEETVGATTFDLTFLLPNTKTQCSIAKIPQIW